MAKKTKEEVKDKVLEEPDDKIYEIPDLPKRELNGCLLNVLGTKTEDILEENYVNPKELEVKTLEDIMEDKYNFNEIKDVFDNASVPQHLEFFYAGDNDDFVTACNFLSINKDSNEFISFLCSDRGQNIMTNKQPFHTH